MTVKKFSKMLASVSPVIIIAGLLYAGLFIKPEPQKQDIKESLFERGDRYYGIATSKGGGLWLVGSDGKILKTEDSGLSWNKLSSGIKAGLQDIAVWNDGQAIAVGNGPRILKTNDGGQTWESVDVPQRNMATKLLRVRKSGDGNAWAVGEGGMVLTTSDYGSSWKLIGEEEDVAWNDIYFQGKNGWLVGEFGQIKLTHDSGETWSKLDGPVKSSLMSVVFKDEKEGIAVGLNGVILGTQDGGESWNILNSSTEEHLFGALWDGTQWVVVGDKGVVLLNDGASSKWKIKRVDDDDRSWHVNLVAGDDKYFLVGANFATVDKKDWQFEAEKE